VANMDVVKFRKETKENTLNTVNLQGTQADEKAVRDPVRVAYQELPGLRHETKDVLKQLHTNIQMIEDLGGRLGFIMSEIRTLIRR
jgi:hypothetical protein